MSFILNLPISKLELFIWKSEDIKRTKLSWFMHKKLIFVVLSILILFVFIFFTTAQSSQTRELMNQNTNSETLCTSTRCTTTVYSYDKYFNRNGIWEEINESWHNCGDNFCTNNYYFNTTVDMEGIMTMQLNNQRFSQQISSFANQIPILSLPVIRESTLTYYNILPNIDLRYQYLPHKIKEEIIINQPLQNIPQRNLEINFTISDFNNFNLELPFICDSNRKCNPINYTLSFNQISFMIPSRFLNSENTIYPVIIDPSFSLGNSSIIWNGRIEEYFDGDALSYFRINNPTILEIGAVPTGYALGNLDWNLASVPNPEVINNATLNLFFEKSTASNFVNITHIDKNSSQWIDDYIGNLNFLNDIRNGTIYSNVIFTSNNSNFSQDFIFNQEGLNKLAIAFNSTDRFSTGIDTLHTSEVTISARDNVNMSRRPQLIITYDLSNSSSDDAIEKGINNTLPNNLISSNQQIYIVGLNSQHSLGRLDKVTTRNNQTWAFNYVGYGESLINLSSLLNIVNVWQNSSLNYTEIVNQVQTFINNTLIP